ncbi:HlyU family transcriptional regulator [Pinisolibacter aquiterrae]|uniref:HlyU family transcriptional regulator n=1 Tax=Pinisolibacter aquiterrae TaxID=2815579 RepID=UPI001C3E6A43|nr:HlyU family transcriptional regulator [Pinisolibacter aquiterrae]MBV5265171.1 hypothetical protein [Pinisolibacter aquiterrae]MCC8235499.1 HlyU family transcriptional regulator [Pinisolibacter aquiterrae]
MSLLKRLFGRSSDAPTLPAAAPSVEFDGFTVRATPYPEAGQFQLCGVISKEIGGVVKEHRFVRADRFTDMDTAVEMTFTKARLIIAQSGGRLFD